MLTLRVVDMTSRPTPQEFGRVFEGHYDLVYRTAYGITGRVEDAEDVVQRIFVELLKHESPPDLTKNPGGYLYRMALSTSFKIIRARRRYILTADPEQFEASTETSNSDYDEAVDACLRKALAELSNESAVEMLVLRYMHGRSLKDIAALLGTTRSTVAVSLFRSRARLKKLIRAFLGEQNHET